MLTIHLVLREAQWYPDADGGASLMVQAFAEEGRQPQIPGPLVRVPEGTEIHASVRNSLSTAAVVHGLHQRPGAAKDALEIPAGRVREVQFNAGKAGTYHYWATTTGKLLENREPQETQLAGAFIVDPPGATRDDRIFVIGLWYQLDPQTDDFITEILTMNGRSWPYTERFTIALGQPVHWRVINASGSDHAMHLHGFYYEVDSVGDGERDEIYTEEARRTAVTEHIDPGRTMSMTWVPREVGRWIFHCHMFAHMTPHPPVAGQAAVSASHSGAREDDGMGGLVLGITVLPAENRASQAQHADKPRRLWLYLRDRPATPVSLGGIGVRVTESPLDEAKEASVPAPAIVLTRGQPVEITVVNQLSTPTSIHWHGIELESYYDGVAGWGGDSRRTTPNIPPGEKFIARMAPPRAGTFIYHTHWHDVQQMVGGLTGPLVVLEPRQKFNPETDKIFLASRSVGDEGNQLLLLNGNSQPRPVSLRAGTKYRFRFINITPNDSDLQVSLLAGTSPVKWRAIAKDGKNLPPAQAREQEALQGITVGETYDFEVQPDKPGDLTLQVLAPFSKRWVTMALNVVPPAR